MDMACILMKTKLHPYAKVLVAFASGYLSQGLHARLQTKESDVDFVHKPLLVGTTPLRAASQDQRK